MSPGYVIAAIAVCAVITIALRAFPFVLVKVAHRRQALFAFLGAVMPPGIMAILAIYGITTLQWQGAQAVVSAVALVVLVLLEHRLRRPVISLCSALALYVAGQSLLNAGILG
ncbi:MAG: AzlD domain-containing protein [Cardiobacteriaceae bacterium]|nr:AzlD domain-containing protein [Cardiobacteriaceae bacterium]